MTNLLLQPREPNELRGDRRRFFELSGNKQAHHLNAERAPVLI